MRVGEVGFRVRVTSYLFGHCGLLLKISWRFIKIWMRYEGLILDRGVKCLRAVQCSAVQCSAVQCRESAEEQDFSTCLALPCLAITLVIWARAAQFMPDKAAIKKGGLLLKEVGDSGKY